MGTVFSLVNHPASMTHASIPQEVREKNGITNGLLRLSVGCEDVDDLIEDMQQVLAIVDRKRVKKDNSSKNRSIWTR